MSAVIIPFPASRIVRTPPLDAASEARLQALAARIFAAIERAPSLPKGSTP